MKPQVCRVVIAGEDGCDTRGLLHEDAAAGTFRVSFRYGGDSVDVELNAGGLHYARRGAQFVDAVYAEGQRTVCRIGTGPYAGEFEVRTDRVEIARHDGRTDVCVEYRSGGPAEENHIIKMIIYGGI